MSYFNFKKLTSSKFLKVISIFSAVTVLFLVGAYCLQAQLITIYDQQSSVVIRDRAGKIIFIEANPRGRRAQYLDDVPTRIKRFLVRKEDKYFFYHPGFNPWSMFWAMLGYLGMAKRRGSSTISQQLVKILLQNELKRNLKNKIIETIYAFSLEIFHTKQQILKMYANSIYFGYQVQGLKEASQLYFGKPPYLLTDGEILQLLATINKPSANNPSKPTNKPSAYYLAKRFGLDKENLVMADMSRVKQNMQNYLHYTKVWFEVRTLHKNKNFPKSSTLTIDAELNKRIREIVARNIEYLKFRNAQQAAVVVIKLPDNELLALVGSPNPQSLNSGYQINMALEPRPIGSTVKPFIYLKAFEKGLRPYTLVDDREYRYIVASGFPLYPKNFDYKYRGLVTLHYALSNSLNVPALKVLEYVGLDNFDNFLEKDLGFKPFQNLQNYQLGIALGYLEMSLLNLAKYYTIFPNSGRLRELRFDSQDPGAAVNIVAQPQYTQLINKVLNDRKTGIEQFGLKSILNLFQKNYALKTGTSRDFRDSWLMGYTPDFLVGVWVGNSNNAPMDEITGQQGAGRIWAQTMELLLNSKYNQKTPFDFSLVHNFNIDGEIEYGLVHDDYRKCQTALEERDQDLILSPHNGDTFLLDDDTEIILKAKENVKWYANKFFLSEGKTVVFIPKKPGLYKVRAIAENGFLQEITISINQS